jgi:hypothetical protein
VRYIAIAVLWGAGAPLTVAGVLSTRVVAQVGDVVPINQAGTTRSIASLHPFATDGIAASIAPDGAVAFAGTIAGSAAGPGLWVNRNGTNALLSFRGMPVPNTPDAIIWESFTGIPPSPGSSHFAYPATIRTSGTDTDVLFSGQPDHRSVVLAPGQPAPGIAGATLGSFAAPKAEGEYINVSSSLVGATVTPATARVLLSLGPTGGRVVARQGDQAPGSLTGTTFEAFQPLKVAAADGRTVFSASLSGVAGDSPSALFRDNGSGLPPSLLFQRGVTTSPTLPADSVFETGAVGVSRNGESILAMTRIAGTGIHSDNDFGVWRHDGVSFQPVVREGDALKSALGAESGRTLVGLTDRWINPAIASNDSGQFLMLGYIRGSAGADRFGLIGGLEGDVRLLVDFQEVTALPAGQSIQSVRAVLPLNNNGRFVLEATLTGTGVDATNNFAIFAGDLGGQLFMVARKGSLFEFAPGEFATVSMLDGEFGFGGLRAESLNDRDEFVFLARLDGQQTLLVTTIPGPSSLALITVATTLTLRRRLRDR